MTAGAGDAVTLEAVARAAETTVPTILRHFATRDALVAAALGAALARVRARRPRVKPGDHRAAARALAGEYEAHAMTLRATDVATQQARRELEPALRLHRDWLARTFSASLSPLLPLVHRRRLAQLAVVSGPAPWRALREDEGLSVPQAEAALAELLYALTPRPER